MQPVSCSVQPLPVDPDGRNARREAAGPTLRSLAILHRSTAVHIPVRGPAVRHGFPSSTIRPVLDDDYPVGIVDRRQSVGDDKGGPVLHQVFQGLLDLSFRFGVKGRGGLVENQDRRVLQDRPGDGDPLAFAAGEPGAAFADDGIETLRQIVDEIEGMGRLRGVA